MSSVKTSDSFEMFGDEGNELIDFLVMVELLLVKLELEFEFFWASDRGLF